MTQTAGLEELKGLTQKFTFDPREGIDNPTMLTTDDPEHVSDAPAPRLCVLRRDEGKAYGFNLRVERGARGHLVRKVVSQGAAERAGLRDGDRVLEVNGHYVDKAPHPEVARRIRVSGNQLCVLVLDGEEYERAKAKGQDLLALAKSQEMEGCKSPRLCHVTKSSNSGLGISFTPVEGEKGSFAVSLVSGGAAERAGVRWRDRLVWMNGAAVSDLTHSALTRMVKKCGDAVTILVVDGETQEKYAQRKMPILPAMATPCNLPHRARSLSLAPGPQGYGFLLREEAISSGRPAHVVREVDAGSPAQKAGLLDGDLLLEVNGEPVEALTHEDVVECVKQSGTEITLTTISAQGFEFYSKLGLSPLLFCGDVAGETQPDRDNLLPAVAEGTPEVVGARPRASSEEVGASLSASSEEDIAQHHCVEKEPVGLGLDVDCVQDTPGNTVSQVTPGGPAHSAGPAEGEAVSEVNGHHVEGERVGEVLPLGEAAGSHPSPVVNHQGRHGNDTTSSTSDPGDSEEEAENSFL